MTIYPYTFASIGGASFPVGANNDGRLYQILANKMKNGDIKRYDFSNPVNTALNRQYSGTAIIAGGRYFELVNEQVVLVANTTNFITLNIDLSNPTSPITISNESNDLSNTTDINKNNGLLRVCFESVITGASSVISVSTKIETDNFQNIIVSGTSSLGYTLTNGLKNTGNIQTGTLGTTDLTASGQTTLGNVKATKVSVTGDTEGWQTLLSAGNGKFKCVNGTVTIQWDVTQGGSAGNFAIGDLPSQYVPSASIMTAATAFSGSTANDTHMQINGGSGGGGITILSAKANQRYAGQYKFDI